MDKGIRNGDMMNGGQGRGEGMMERKNGPSSQEMDQQQEQKQLDQDKKMKQQMLKRMQSGVKQFSKMLAGFKTKMDKLVSQGAPVPAECKTAVEKALTTVNTITTATDPEAVGEADMSDLQEMGQTLQECGPKLEQAAQLPRIIKQIKSQITQLEKRVKSIQTKTDRAKVDVSSVLGKVNEAIAGIKTMVAGLATDDDPFSTIQDMPADFQDIQQQLNGLEAVFQVQKTLKSIGSQLTKYEQKVKRLEAKGEGEEARTTLDELKGLVTELKGMSLNDETADELPNKLQQLFELKQTLDESLQSAIAPKLFDASGAGGQFNFDLPSLNKLMLDQTQLQRYVAKLDERIVAGAQRVAGLKIINSAQQ